jgi:putative peptide zinc metalloprotease protein
VSGRAYRPPAGWSSHPFDSAAREATFLVEEPGGRRWQVSEATVQLLEALESEPTLELAARRVQERWGRPVAPGMLRDYLDRVLVPDGMVAGPGGEAGGGPDPRGAGGRLAYLTFRRTLLPERALHRLTRPFAVLYHPRLFWVAFAAALACAAAYLAAVVPRLASIPAAMLLPGAMVTGIASMFVHELGHAAACRRFGARHGSLGWGLYLVFPVLFMEVDQAWRLPRPQRLVVDAGGLFLQLLFGLGVAAAGLAFPAVGALAPGTMLFVAFALVSNLNPVFRFDGYWLVSDALGIANLRQKSGEMIRALFAREPGRAVLPGGAGRRTVVLLVAYAVLSNVFFVAFFARLAVELPGYVLHVYPSLAAGQAAEIRASIAAVQPLRALRAVFTLAPPTAMVAGIPLMLLVRLRAMVHARQRRMGRPVPTP